MASKAQPKDFMPNRARIPISVAAATTTVVATTIDTLMGSRERTGWIVSRWDVQPKALLDGWGLANNGMRFQLCVGEQTTLLDADDEMCIGTLDVVTLSNASGTAFMAFPLTWVGPIMIAHKKLTALIQGSDNIAPLQTLDFIFTVWYNYIEMGAQEWIELIQAKGIY